MTHMKPLDFLVLASHGSGIHAFDTYVNMLAGVRCLGSNVNREQVDAFLAGTPSGKNGLVLDSAAAIANGLLEHVLRHAGKDCILVILGRDPLQRLKSVVNTHVLWWAESAAGVFERSAYATVLYAHGDVGSLTASMLAAENMNTVPQILPLVSPIIKRRIYFDIHDLYPENAPASLNNLYQMLYGVPLPFFPAIPDTLIYRKENSFVRFIKKLFIPYNDVYFGLTPCPREFCDALGLTSRIVVECDPREVGFSLGTYDRGAGLAFVLADRAHHAPENAQRIAREILEKEPSRLVEYCTDLSRRNHLALTLSRALELTDECLAELARQTPDFGRALRNFLERPRKVLAEAGIMMPEQWDESSRFMSHHFLPGA